jgi:subtilisin family serine protease
VSEGNGRRPPSEQDLRAALARTYIGADLLREMHGETDETPAAALADAFDVIIEANSRFPGGAQAARLFLAKAYLSEHPDDPEIEPVRRRGIDLAMAEPSADYPWPKFRWDDRLFLDNSFWTHHHLLGRLTRETIERLAYYARDLEQGGRTPPVYKIWRNHPVRTSVFESVRTVKCDAAHRAFGASGEGVVWAVADTGIDGTHPHFHTHETLKLPAGLDHHEFTPVPAAGAPAPPNGPDGQPLHPALVDAAGHGTHVGGIIAGETLKTDALEISVTQEVREGGTRIDTSRTEIAGVAPKTKLMSLKVLTDTSAGDVGLLLAAIGYVQTANDQGADVKVHGLNLSLGYAFDARWFAAGQSPLCVEVNRLVRSGVVVVIAAGNGGYGTVQTLDRTAERATHLGTINDPGNAELAITVGSTHRDMPHTYGVSYFSGKGPTADGRMKPDLVAPGERIVSCERHHSPEDPAAAPPAGKALFNERSGTSMAAPHVSGAIAGFLSVRREFKGQADKVKAIFKESATDLGREAMFQGAGLIDAMRALQSV